MFDNCFKRRNCWKSWQLLKEDALLRKIENVRMFLLLYYIALTFYLFNSFCPADAFRKCGGRYYYGDFSRDRFACCGNRLVYKRNKFVTCCGSGSYNPSSQGCCAGVIYKRTDINSGCCYGKPFQRGKQMCCGRQVIDIKKQGCCRNVPFDKGYAACCQGMKTPNPDFMINKDPKCCGMEIYNPRYKVCCAETIAPNVAGIFTRCCEKKSYDFRRQSCCGKIIPRRARSGEACCAGKMMNTKTHLCCGYSERIRLPGEDNACCKIHQRGYIMYDRKKQVCCSEKVQWKRAKETSCCVREAYDVNTEICCNKKVYRRNMYADERCCASGPYDRNKQICCEKKLYDVPRYGKKYTFCCGAGIYDRRKFECRYIRKQGYKLISLDRGDE